MEKGKWESRSAKLLFALLAILIIYVTLRYAFGIIFPFLAAFIIAMPLISLSERSSKHFGGTRKSWGMFYVLSFWLFLSVAIFALIGKLLAEAGALFEFFGEHISQISERLSAALERLLEFISNIPILQNMNYGIGQDTEAWISVLLGKISAKGSELVSATIGKMAVWTPRAAIGFVICIISSFYFCKDWEKIKDYAINIIPLNSRERATKIVLRISSGIKSYLRAYFWLFLITFGELFVGLTLLGRRYALVCALLIAALDILPLFGSGIVLVPWAIVLIVSDAVGAGVGMLVLFAVITVARQILEPRLVGGALGIHPLATLAAMYIGFRAFGIVGMLISPLVIVAFKEMNEIRQEAPKAQNYQP